MSGSTGGGGVGHSGTGGVDSSIALQAGRGVQNNGLMAQSPHEFANTLSSFNQLKLFPLKQQELEQQLELQKLGITGKGIENERGGVALTSEQAALTEKRNAIVANGMMSLAFDPNATPATVAARLGQLRDSGAHVDGLLSGFTSSKAVTAPEINAFFRNEAIRANPKLGEPNYQLVDDGKEKRYIDTNPFTNGGRPPAPITNKLTPEQRVQTQPALGPDNQPGTVPIGEKYDDQGNLLPAGGSAPGATGAAKPGEVAPPAPRGFTPTQAKPGTAEYAKDAATAAAVAQTRAGQFASDMFPLTHAMAALEKAPTGRGSEALHNVSAVISTIAPDRLARALAWMTPLMRPDEVAAYDEAKKYLTQVQLGVPGATRSNEGAATGGAASPSPSISNEAAKIVLQGMIGLRRMEQASTLAFNDSKQEPSKYFEHQTKFSTTADPRVYTFDMMDPKQKRETLDSFKDPAKLARFKASVRAAEAAELLAPP